MLKHQLIAVENLTVYFGKQMVFEGVDFSLHSGDKCLISGSSGSGKSVFLYTLLGLLPASAIKSGLFKLYENGKLQAFDYENYQKSSHITELFGVVFQDAIHSLHPFRNIQDQAPVAQKDLDFIDRFSDFFLDYHYLCNQNSIRLPRHCSGGECQRLSLLFATLADKSCILFDEPLTDIDHVSRSVVQASIRKILDDPDKTIVLISHDWSWITSPYQHYVVDECKLRKAKENDLSADVFDLGIDEQRVLSKPIPPQVSELTIAARLKIKEPLYFPGNETFYLSNTEIEVCNSQNLGIVGSSGSGKSSLLRLFSGLSPSRFYHEKLELSVSTEAGQLANFRTFKRRQWFARTQVVFQDTTGSFMPGEKLINHFRRIERFKGAGDKFWKALDVWGAKLSLFRGSNGATSSAHELLTIPESQQFLEKRFDDLSMGMRRRTGLLRAFLLLNIYNTVDNKSPKILLLDEISRGLDSANRLLMAKAISEYCKAYNVTTIAVSHDFSFLSEFCDCVQIMYSGTLLPLRIGFNEVLEMRRGEEIKGADNPYYGQFIRGDEALERLSGIETQ